MIQAKDLRLGNWVYGTNGKPGEVTLEALVYLQAYEKNHQVTPIPLTEEWLVNFGFIFHEKMLIYIKKWGENGEEYIERCRHVNRLEYLVGGNGNYRIPLEHVHQLQNLYHSLTLGKELELKEV